MLKLCVECWSCEWNVGAVCRMLKPGVCVQVLMEVVAVNSAVYSVVLSLVVCMCAVAIFTGHILMLAVITITIIGKWTTFLPMVGDQVVQECCTMGLCGLGDHCSCGWSVGRWGWLNGMECWTRDRKIVGSSPGRSGGRIFFSRVNFLC